MTLTSYFSRVSAGSPPTTTANSSLADELEDNSWMVQYPIESRKASLNPFSLEQLEDGGWVVVDEQGRVKDGPFSEKGKAYQASKQLWMKLHTMAGREI